MNTTNTITFITIHGNINYHSNIFICYAIHVFRSGQKNAVKTKEAIKIMPL